MEIRCALFVNVIRTSCALILLKIGAIGNCIRHSAPTAGLICVAGLPDPPKDADCHVAGAPRNDKEV